MSTQREPLIDLKYASIVLGLIGKKPKRQQPNRKRGKYLYMVNEQPERRCLLCAETRCLERAHIIPVGIYEHLSLEGEIAPIYHHAMWMCPTHHKCYDKFQLNTAEKEHISWILSHGYRLAFEYLLSDIEILKTPLSPKSQKIMDTIVDVSWHWWREYYRGY